MDCIETIKVEDTYGDLKDYKFFCFNGKVRCFKVDFNRFSGHRANYYSPDGDSLMFGEKQCPPDFDHIEVLPKNLQQMIAIAESLSNGIPFSELIYIILKNKYILAKQHSSLLAVWVNLLMRRGIRS